MSLENNNQTNCNNSYDIAVIGAGHAGVEAALSCARLGMKTILFTINMDAVANMPFHIDSFGRFL